MEGDVVLVLGSHPPVSSPAAAATVAAVRREMAAGRTVVTASPRPSAAALVVRAAGPLAAARLERIRRRTGATRLVMAVEAGFPVAARPSRTTGRSFASPLTLVPLFVGLRRFAHVSLLVSDPSPATGWVITWLGRAVDEVVLSGDAAVPEAVAAVAGAHPGVRLRVLDAPAVGAPLPGVTPLGPADPVSIRLRRTVPRVGRRLLGPMYIPLRVAVVPVERAVQLARKRRSSARRQPAAGGRR